MSDTTDGGEWPDDDPDPAAAGPAADDEPEPPDDEPAAAEGSLSARLAAHGITVARVPVDPRDMHD